MLEDCWNEDPELRWEARCMCHRFSNPTTARVQGMPCVIGALRPVGFSVQLDHLQVDDCPKYLAKSLGFALKEHPIHKQHNLNFEIQKEGVEALLEVFDKVLEYRPFDPLISKQFRQLCGRSELVPASYFISRERISTVGEHPVASGGFGDVWKGIYEGRHVAIKALRVYKRDDMRKVKRIFYKEVTMWKRFSHPNIVPFLGVTDAPAPLSMVLQWMSNGDIRHYVRRHLEADRLQLMLDICHGLQVLHTHNVVHGDLKGANILINNSGWACLIDFGLSSIASLSCTESSAHGPCGSFRWTAPELMRITESQHARPTKESDIYALAMVAIEVFTGLIPFESCKADPAVMLKVINGERPARPTEAAKLGLTDDLWDLIQSAWAQDAQHRPPVETIIDFLLRVT
ncbi:kinase-like protein [Thelephora ganbajun]|uniref:Kinase-like protein n=1 Tax=Thelephora ganbajun TaxID=370292 RepID=A0ACB6ZPE3_THEGA|nr:kinase-like protein [Thelephora ganbajun]